MDTSVQMKPIRKYAGVAIVSFVSGLMTMIFPIISILYRFTENGGAGYLQSLFCGIPVASASIIIGIVSLVLTKRSNQKGDRMATFGIVFGILFFLIFIIMVIILLSPFLFE
jgi:MFS-type transporter involved in bile tolerance (Atg22 family)